MKVVVMGAGALGSLVGGLLSRQHDVTLVGRKEHLEVVRAAGLRITGATQLVARPGVALSGAEASTPDVLMLTTKAYDTQRALRDARPLLGPHTAVLSLQNGLGNLEHVRAAAGDVLALGGVTTHGVTFVEPGHVHHAGVGYTKVGGVSPAALPLARELAEALTGAGLATDATDRIEAEIWAKAIVNAGINPLTAITGLPNGQLLEQPGLKALLEAVVAEARDAALAAGVALPEGDLVERARMVARMTAPNKSSMLQDVERGRRTEIDSLCGAIVAAARGAGTSAPLNAALLALVRGIESTTRVG
ncbi:MAG TPA: ketopantoate reductase family protein [Candidatus Thermoplasmatota archaeon]|nr:ketopantoate reductase family protein [Candidatus Thermoplasmatota archaeon]